MRSWAAGGITVVGALVGTFAAVADPDSLPSVEAAGTGGGVAALAILVALLMLGRLVTRATASVRWWALPLGAIGAVAELAGISLSRKGGGLGLITESSTSELAWLVVRAAGVAWLMVCLIVLAMVAAQSVMADPRPAEKRLAQPRSFPLLWAALLLTRLPFLLLLWPGIVPFDTFRSYAYARRGGWEQYEPVGHSLLVASIDWTSSALGLGDTGGVAIGAVIQMLTSTAAFAFLLVRLAAWGVDRRVWWAAAGWTLFVPIFGIFSVTVVKDVPFTSALVVFSVCLGELVYGTARRWPCVVMAASGLLLIVTRNNGVHVVVLTLVIAVIVAAGHRRPLGIVLGVCILGFVGYGVVADDILKAKPVPAVETWSVPIQQLGRIAKYDAADLSAADRRFVEQVFAPLSLKEIGDRYDPYIADPVKSKAAEFWTNQSSGDFLRGWARVAANHPVSATVATMGGTVGYWAPGAPSWDGMIFQSHNDVRGVHLAIPYGRPTHGLRGVLTDHGLLTNRGWRATPLLGLLLSPAIVLWAWLVAGAAVLRARNPRGLLVFLPAAALLATVLAGPVSGGMRYALGFYACLPIALAAATLRVQVAERKTHRS
jgi:hypothetical protein